MREVSKLPKTVQTILSLIEKHDQERYFNPTIMGDLSIQEFEEMEAHLKNMHSSKAIRETLEAIDHTRLAGMGPWEGTLPPLKLPEKLKTLIYAASHRNMTFGDEHNLA